MEKCQICKSKIEPAAKKCVHCGAWQGWRMVMNISSTLLSNLVALISVLGIVVPIIFKQCEASEVKQYLTSQGTILIKPGSNTQYSTGEGKDLTFYNEYANAAYAYQLSILVINSGKKDGVLTKAEVRLEYADDEIAFGSMPLTEVIKAGSSDVVTYSIPLKVLNGSLLPSKFNSHDLDTMKTDGLEITGGLISMEIWGSDTKKRTEVMKLKKGLLQIEERNEL